MDTDTSFDFTQILGLIVALIAVAATLGELIYNLFFRKKPAGGREEKGSREILQGLLPEKDRGGQHKEKEKAYEESDYFEDEYVEEDFSRQEIEREKIPLSTTTPPSPPPLISPEVKSTYQGLPVHLEEKFEFHPSMEAFKQKTSIESRALEIHLRRSSEELVSDAIKKFGSDEHFVKKAAPPRIRKFLVGLSSKRALLIAKEIIDLPLSLRDKTL